jgi:NhaA family Na+:H+ antiporter
MATDIAFAVGVLALLGKRVPAALRVLLLALAIIDDVGAILVIALFYSTEVTLSGLAISGLGVLLILIMQRLGVRSPALYVLPGAVIWAGMLTAGIHPTIAGVLIGLLTPVRPWFGGRGFVKEAERTLETFRQQLRLAVDQHELARSLKGLDQARREAFSPVVRLEVALHRWVSFLIMPIFAFANAGVTLGEVQLAGGSALCLGAGIILGLALGKPMGIVGAGFLASALGLAAFPRGVDWKGLLVVGMVGGIGFTMSLFIAALAFSDPMHLGIAKLAVLAASLLAGVSGILAGFLLLPREMPKEATQRVGNVQRLTRTPQIR